MKIESPEFEHGRVYFKPFGAERVNLLPFSHTDYVDHGRRSKKKSNHRKYLMLEPRIDVTVAELLFIVVIQPRYRNSNLSEFEMDYRRSPLKTL